DAQAALTSSPAPHADVRIPIGCQRFRRSRTSDGSPKAAGSGSDQLRGKHSKELGVAHRVAAAKPTRLLNEPVQPFQPNLLHPFGSAACDSGNHVDRASHAHSKLSTGARAVLSEPVLLSWRRHRHQQDVGRPVADLFREHPFLALREIAVMPAAQVQARIALLKRLDRSVQDVLAGTEDVYAVSAALS